MVCHVVTHHFILWFFMFNKKYIMVINKNETYIELTDESKTILIPANAAILVDDESGLISVKTLATRKTIAVGTLEE